MKLHEYGDWTYIEALNNTGLTAMERIQGPFYHPGHLTLIDIEAKYPYHYFVVHKIHGVNQEWVWVRDNGNETFRLR